MLDEKVALEKLDGCAAALKKVISSVKSWSDEKIDPKITEQICQDAKASKQCLDVVTVCKGSSDEDSVAKATSLEEEVKELRQLIDSEFHSSLELSDFLDGQWRKQQCA